MLGDSLIVTSATRKPAQLNTRFCGLLVFGGNSSEPLAPEDNVPNSSIHWKDFKWANPTIFGNSTSSD